MSASVASSIVMVAPMPPGLTAPRIVMIFQWPQVWLHGCAGLSDNVREAES
jgi:hypothetical protein